MDELHCDFCGDWTTECTAEEFGWIKNYFHDAAHSISMGAAVCDRCKKQFLEQGDNKEWHYRED